MKITNTPLGWFRVIAFLEGVSFLLLLFVAMPLKYIGGYPEAVKTPGMAHGVLFVGYVIFCLICTVKYKWTIIKFFILIGLSFVPFGTFWGDRKYLQSEQITRNS